MKYVVVLGDGMADWPIAELGNKTPLEVANKPTIDFLAKRAQIGMVNHIPEGMEPGSDTANLSVMGYDPSSYYSGRSPLEAVSMGIDLTASDVTYRCNFVTLSEDAVFEEKQMIDHSSDEITSEEAAMLVKDLQRELLPENLTLYAGVSYRNCLVWKNGAVGQKLVPPHDILGKRIKDYLPQGDKAGIFIEIMKRANAFLEQHPVNIARVKKGLRPANGAWFWGEGQKPHLPLFEEKFGLKGVMVSAVDLLKGIGLCAGLQVVDIPGATGNLNTNYEGKVAAAIEALQNGCDFAYVHIEAPDECGHRGEIANKIKSIEYIDQRVVKPLLEELQRMKEPYQIMILPDHPTPVAIRTHTAEPVPYLIYRSDKEENGVDSYTEKWAEQTGRYVQYGHKLLQKFLTGCNCKM